MQPLYVAKATADDGGHAQGSALFLADQSSAVRTEKPLRVLETRSREGREQDPDRKQRENASWAQGALAWQLRGFLSKEIDHCLFGSVYSGKQDWVYISCK